MDFNHLNRFSNSVPSPTLLPNATPGNPNGFVGVLPTDIYSPGLGFGWLKPASSFDNGHFVNDPRGDFNRDGAKGNESNSFFVELPNDTYDVTVTMGTLQDLDGLRLRANGRNVLYGGETGAAEYLQTSFRVSVINNLLSLEVGSSGLLPNWAINGIEIRSANLVTPITFDRPLGSRSADGANTVRVTANTQVAAGQQVTVSTSLGTITTPDVNPEFLGTQVIVPASGVVSFDVLAPMRSGVASLAAKSLDGKHQGTIQNAAYLSWFVPTSRRFDFNHVSNGWQSGESKTALGALGVTRLDRSAATVGYGWERAPNSYDEANPNRADQAPPAPGPALVTSIDILQDYAGGHSDTGGRTFQVEAKPGIDYDVRAFTGSRFKDQSIQVRVEGTRTTQAVATTAGFFSALTFFNAHDTNGDGMLDISFGSGGDLSPLWMTNGLDIAESTVGLPATAPLLLGAAATPASISNIAHDVSPFADSAVGTQIGSVSIIDQAKVAPILARAIEGWILADLTDDQRQRLSEVKVTIENLDQFGALGLAGSRHIVIDDNALGRGWQLDDNAAPGINLGAVLLHELGHILGLPDLDPALHASEIMSGVLGG